MGKERVSVLTVFILKVSTEVLVSCKWRGLAGFGVKQLE